MSDAIEVLVGSIWRENDSRFVRHVKVIEIGETAGEKWARIAVCNPTNGWTADRTTKARLRRFGKAYKSISEQPRR